jgi:hypothetical protein
MTPRRTLIVATVGLAATGALAAGLQDYSAVTYNSQGAKWSDVVSLVPNYDVVAVQEAGAQPNMWGKATSVAKKQCNDESGHTTHLEVFEYHWSYDTGGKTAYVYFLESDAFGSRVNVAFIVKQKSSSTTILCPARDNTKKGVTGRPILGITMPNGTTYYTMHAGSYGDNHYNDADNIVKEVTDSASTSGCWAILGDFNRDPKKLNVSSDRLVNSGMATHMGDAGGELDYMVVPNKKCKGDLSAAVLNGKGSDHAPVAFKGTKR